jgi:hypothetical protein
MTATLTPTTTVRNTLASLQTTSAAPTTTAVLSELAYVLHLTRQVKGAILEEKEVPATVSA